jgi:hypothetical protein
MVRIWAITGVATLVMDVSADPAGIAATRRTGTEAAVTD